MIIAISFWLVFGITSAIVASNHGSSGFLWFIFGVLFGPIALILAFTCGKKCPYCASKISTEAIVCPKCQKSLQEKPQENTQEKHQIRPDSDSYLIGGYNYSLLKDKKEQAFCLGCRSSDSMNNLYYCAEKDEYYHRNCLPND